jgi:hypothetical protein
MLSAVYIKLGMSQQAATRVNITRCCKYSQVLLIVEKIIARNK